MLETAVLNGTKELRLQQEVVKARRVNADVAALSSGSTSSDQVTFLRLTVGSHRRTRRDCIVGLNLLIGVVDKVLFVRHVERTRAQRGFEGGCFAGCGYSGNTVVDRDASPADGKAAKKL